MCTNLIVYYNELIFQHLLILHAFLTFTYFVWKRKILGQSLTKQRIYLTLDKTNFCRLNDGETSSEVDSNSKTDVLFKTRWSSKASCNSRNNFRSSTLATCSFFPNVRLALSLFIIVTFFISEFLISQEWFGMLLAGVVPNFFGH